VKEIEKIVREAARARAAGQTLALATVVSIEGSAYRLPGARMLIVDGRWVAGSISGGCLEDDVVLRAREAVRTGHATTATYDTTDDDDIVFGVGLGCKGVITLLIEPLPASPDDVDFIAFAGECLGKRAAGYVATVVRSHCDDGVPSGRRLVFQDGCRRSDIRDAVLEHAIEKRLRSRTVDAELADFDSEHGKVSVFVERILPPTPLVIFGAGHDAMPVVRLAKELGWHVTLVDHRPAYATRERFPGVDRSIVESPRGAVGQIALTSDTLALVMTHNYLRDLDVLRVLLPTPVLYIGLLGPRRRTAQICAELSERDGGVAEGLDRLYAPVGLDIGSESPAEVALSILSEMQAVLTSRSGGHLRERSRPIHARIREAESDIAVSM
jgi:xanthine/CO dehydrogenase XdhC/CoxF family maturation factor